MRAFPYWVTPFLQVSHGTFSGAPAEGQDLEGAALEHLPRGRDSPWIPVFLRTYRGWGPSLYRLFTPCFTAVPFVDDRPPTHFFVKKKFSPACGVIGTTQKGSSGFCEAHTLCGTGSIPRAGGSFFLYEKSVLRESDFLRGREREVCTDLTHPFSAPKKALFK